MTSASSSAPTTPLKSTPSVALSSSSNGAGGGIPSSPTAETSSLAKKSRRQAAMYDHTGSPKPVKPFSRSAAKRESVMALGSIEHLQQFFKKTGMVNKKNPLFDKKHYGLVPAIGGMPLSPTNEESEEPPSIASSLLPQEQPTLFHRPQPPTVVVPHIKTSEAHPDTLLPGVIAELNELVKIWAIDDPSRASSQPIDVLPLLRATTRTIHTVRNYALSLPDDSSTSVKEEYKPRTLSAQSTGQTSASTSSGPDALTTPLNPLARIRKSSLEVLGCLRGLEETARIPLSDDAYDASSDNGGPGNGTSSRGISRGPSPALDLSPSSPTDTTQRNQYYGDLGITFSLVQVHGRYEKVAVWEDEDLDFPAPDDDTPTSKREMWHETLEVANGWLYRKNITLSDLPAERAVIRAYLDGVDDALFPPSKPGEAKRERGWEIERKKLEARTSRFAGVGGLRSSKIRRVSSGEILRLNHRSSSPSSPSRMLLDSSGEGKRRVSTGMLNLTTPQIRYSAEPEEMAEIREEEDVAEEAEESDQELEDDDLPDWAKRSSFENDELGRAYNFVATYLPPSHHHALVPPSPSSQPPHTPSTATPTPNTTTPPSRTAFLSSLSSGQLLCLAYNVCVRKSKHPWGFVSKEGIHDILALEAKAAIAAATVSSSTTNNNNNNMGNGNKTGWTFRRSDNLRLWIGALKLRYMLPIQMPAQLISSLPPSLLKLPSVVSAASARSQGGPRGMSPGPLRTSKSASPSPSVSSTLASTSASTPTSTSTSISTTPASQSTSTTTSTPTPTPGSKPIPETVLFDVQVVARKDDGWEDMLEKALVRWMWKAVGERRKAVLPEPIG